MIGVEKDIPSILKTLLLLGRIMLIKSPVSSFKTTQSYTQCSEFIRVFFGIGGRVGLLPVMFLFFTKIFLMDLKVTLSCFQN